MSYQHKNLAAGRWNKFSLVEQMANIGSEVGRTINWREKNQKLSQQAFWRALELIDLTVADQKNQKRLKEVLRMREMLVDYFFADNQYHSTDEQWQNYFLAFNYAARINT
ncbi:MAG: hypothetical protein NTW79_01355 [Candidatus Berkelbacteria bacterium]|nr:hypothetical protein [Candidatus Berkelbacteria bacterium]